MAGAIELHNNNRYRPLQKAAIGRLPSYLMNREELMTRMFDKKLIAGATAGAVMAFGAAGTASAEVKTGMRCRSAKGDLNDRAQREPRQG